MLLLGITDRTHEMVGVPPEIIGDNPRVIEQKIRDRILSNIESTPVSPFPPRLYVRAFQLKNDCSIDQDGFVVLVYVKKVFDAVYYSKSKKDERAYIREGDRSRYLKINEVITLVEQKEKPQLIAIYDLTSFLNYEANLELQVYNIGSKPAERIYARTTFSPWHKCLQDKTKEKSLCLNNYHIKLSKTPSRAEVVSTNKERIIIDYKGGFPITTPIYPRVPSLILKDIGIKLESPLNIKPKEKSSWIMLPITTYLYNESTYTLQECYIKVQHNNFLLSQRICPLIIIKDYNQKIIFEEHNIDPYILSIPIKQLPQ